MISSTEAMSDTVATRFVALVDPLRLAPDY
jgi:hypothetical protein